MVCDELSAAIDRLVAVDPAELADPETTLALQREAARLAALATRSVAALDESQTWKDDGALSASHWLRFSARLPIDKAKRQVWLGAALAELPVVNTAWLAGEINDCHVAAIARAQLINPEAMARDEETIVDWARYESFNGFLRGLNYWRYENDPDFGDAAAERMRERRQLRCRRRINGMLTGGFDLPGIGGEIWLNELLRIEQELFEADWAEARARVGEHASADDLCRSTAQRRADAMVEMAIRSSTAPADGQRPAPLFSVFIGWETFHGMLCRLQRGDAVEPGALVPWLDSAWVERVVFDGPSRVIDVGVQRRIFSGATRRAVELRDQECFHPLCDVPAADAQIDHIRPWSDGGETTQDNGRVACGTHNRARHKRRQ
jgi:hypothetical protein